MKPVTAAIGVIPYSIAVLIARFLARFHVLFLLDLVVDGLHRRIALLQHGQPVLSEGCVRASGWRRW